MNVPFDQMSRDEQILAWDAAKKELDALKEREMQMRKHLVATQFDDQKPGTQNVELGKGYKLKAVVKQNYRLDSNTDAVDAALDKLEDWQAERVVKWKAELSISEYKKLDEAGKAAIDEVLTISIASPTLDLVPPKGA